MLREPFEVKTEEDIPDLKSARLVADQKALEVADEPMLLAWYESRSGRFSPDVTCCSEEKPGWLVYAESRGGTIVIDLNEEQYVFVYMDMGAAE